MLHCNTVKCVLLHTPRRRFRLLFVHTDVPTEVDNYHSLFPLEPLPPPNRLQKTSSFNYITSCYKAVNSKDDLPYCLRRIHGREVGWSHGALLRVPAGMASFTCQVLCVFRVQADEHQVYDAGGHVEEDPALKLCHAQRGLHHQGLRRPL